MQYSIIESVKSSARFATTNCINVFLPQHESYVIITYTAYVHMYIRVQFTTLPELYKVKSYSLSTMQGVDNVQDALESGGIRLFHQSNNILCRCN